MGLGWSVWTPSPRDIAAADCRTWEPSGLRVGGCCPGHCEGRNEHFLFLLFFFYTFFILHFLFQLFFIYKNQFLDEKSIFFWSLGGVVAQVAGKGEMNTFYFEIYNPTKKQTFFLFI